MTYLKSAEAFDKPVVALHKVALTMDEAANAMERGEFNFDFLVDVWPPSNDGDGYDTDQLEDLIEWMGPETVVPTF